MRRLLLLLLLIWMVVASPVAAKTLTKVVAVINNDIISSYQLDKAVLAELAKDAKGNQLTSQQFDEMKSRVLEALINEKLVDQRIEELGLTVPNAELNAAVEDVQIKNNLTADMLQRAVEAQGMSFEEYREELKQEILRYKLLGREVNYKVQVTQSEVREYFRTHIDEYRAKPQVRVSSLSFEVPANISEAEMQLLNRQVETVRERLQNGEDFDQVLEAQGDNVFGGDMGQLVEEDLAEQLREGLAGLEVGQVTEPIHMNNQLHLFLVTGRNPGDSGLFDRVEGEIEQILKTQKTDARFKEWAQELRDRGYIDIRI